MDSPAAVQSDPRKLNAGEDMQCTDRHVPVLLKHVLQRHNSEVHSRACVQMTTCVQVLPRAFQLLGVALALALLMAVGLLTWFTVAG